MYWFLSDPVYWTVIAMTVAGGVLLAVRLRAWRDWRTLRALLIIVTGSTACGTVLLIAASFYCARLYPTSPLTFDVVSWVLIAAMITWAIRERRRRRRTSTRGS